MTELTDATEEVLDASLTKLYLQHEAAMAAGDSEARREIHWGITQILEEQSRRLDQWLTSVPPIVRVDS